jgi:two-component system NtrC family sensor kinase
MAGEGMSDSFRRRDPVAVIITDTELNDLYCNEGLARLSGYSADELKREGWITSVDPALQGALEEIASEAKEGLVETEVCVAELFCADGSRRSLQWEIASVSTPSGPLILIVASPAPSESETIETLTKEEKAALRRSMESLSRQANAIAHDYNNLLSGIVGYAGMLEMLPDLPEKARRYVGELKKAADRLTEMTRRLLLFGRKRKLNVQPIDLNRIAKPVLESPDIGRPGQEMLLETLCESIMVSVDPMQIQVLLDNLLQNALAAIEEGGRVTVRTALREADEEFPTVFATAPAGNYGVLEVEDTGKGIEPERLGQIFEPYSDPEYRQLGKGLGLSIVYRIVHNHGGFLQVESKPGKGSRFTVLFPM